MQKAMIIGALPFSMVKVLIRPFVIKEMVNSRKRKDLLFNLFSSVNSCKIGTNVSVLRIYGRTGGSHAI